MTNRAPRKPWWRHLADPALWTHFLFWPWHVVWVFAVLFGVVPFLLPMLLVDTFVGEVPWGITASALALVVLPHLVLIWGWRFRSDHRKLMRLFYGVGGVGFSLVLVRLFFIRETTASVDLLLVTLAAGMAFYAAELFGGLERLGPSKLPVRMVGSSALLVIGIYMGVTMGLYCIPAIVLGVPAAFVGIYEMFAEMRWEDIAQLMGAAPIILSFLAIAFYCAVIVLGLPFALVILYPAAWWRALQAWKQAGRAPLAAIGITVATVAIWLLAFAATSRQAQREVLAELEQPPATFARQAELAARSSEIESGLLTAYLAPYRYWGATGTNVHLARLYRDAFGLDDDWMGVQSVFNRLAAPLLYEGEFVLADRDVAELRYEQFFDRPLQEDQREAVLSAIAATYDRTQAEAGLLDVGQRRVWLRAQDLDVKTEGDIAHFTLHEVYENQTSDPQEIFYYFSLPEHAAVTALWLGDTEDTSRRFPYVVAPRGAAQSVYREQREQRVDPALLEQVGPQQYRLRAFPIPARALPSRWSEDPQALHLWLEWTVMSDGSHFPMPRLAEARNVYWTRSTTRTVAGNPSSHRDWLPPDLEAPARERHEATVGDLRVTATPSAPEPTVPAGKLAIVLDTSRSMAAHAAEVGTVLRSIEAMEIPADLYIAPSPFSADRPRSVPITEADPHYFGGHTLLGIVSQFVEIRASVAYSAVVVLTDEGSFAQRQDDGPASPLGDLGAPLWFVHFGGLPHAYPDAIGDLLERGGGVVTRFEDLLSRLQGGSTDGYRWSVERLRDGEARPATDSAFTPIAAKVAIHHLSATHDLDTIHALAVDHSVATPWSSMIVLVNDAQREALAKASQADDRFDRESESGVETPTSPMAALELTATPEPETWLLLAIAAVALVMMRKRRSLALTPGT